MPEKSIIESFLHYLSTHPKLGMIITLLTSLLPLLDEFAIQIIPILQALGLLFGLLIGIITFLLKLREYLTQKQKNNEIS